VGGDTPTRGVVLVVGVGLVVAEEVAEAEVAVVEEGVVAAATKLIIAATSSSVKLSLRRLQDHVNSEDTTRC
jgi:hypothetical protein